MFLEWDVKIWIRFIEKVYWSNKKILYELV
jgi:hypothetical protein